MDEQNLLYICAGAVAAGFLWFFYKKYAVRTSVDANHQHRKTIARDLLERAIEQRAVMRIELAQEKNNESAKGHCTRIVDNEVYISMNSSVSTVGMLEKKVKIYFCVNLKRKENYFHFYSQVIDFIPFQDNFTMRVALPDSIDTGQKRNFVRVAPHKEAVLALAVWSLSDADNLPLKYEDLPPANFQFRPDKDDEITLDNISGGGMRMLINVDEATLANINLTLGGRLLVLVILRSDDTHKPMPYWTVGKVRIISPLEADEGGISVGLAFVQWAMMERGKDTPISWFPADNSGGIAPLASWTMRHHLEQHKTL